MTKKALTGVIAASVAAWCMIAGAQADMAKQGTYTGKLGWTAVGDTQEIEENHVFWHGVFTGTFFNDGGSGFLHGTSFVCPGVNDLMDGVSMAAHGYCVVTDTDGDKAFMVWQGGKQEQATRFLGDYQWTGGTGKYAGLTGNNTYDAHVIPGTGQGYGLFKGEWKLP